MSPTLPKNLSALDWAALTKYEEMIKQAKAAAYQRACSQLQAKQADDRTKLEKMAQIMGVKLEPALAGIPAVTGNGQHKAAGRKRKTKIAIKFRDPSNHENTWSGRGRPARWLADKMKAGAKREDFRVNA